MGKLIILVGLPGSGKSSYAEDLLDICLAGDDGDYDWVIHSSDAIRKELFGDESSQEDNNRVFQIMHKRVKADLAAGKTVIYDATNVTRKSRRAAINLADLNRDKVECHIIWAPIETCIKRDAERSRNVGSAVIDKFVRRWQSPWYDEGFDQIILNCSDPYFDHVYYTSCMTSNMMIPHDNPHHSADVFDHCNLAREHLLNDDAAKTLKHYDTLVTAAYWHDIGKPYTKGYKNKKGSDEIDYSVAHYYDHHAVGGYLAYGLFMYNDYALTTNQKDMDFISMISWLISTHMEPFFNSKYYQYLHPMYKAYIDALHKADLAAH